MYFGFGYGNSSTLLFLLLIVVMVVSMFAQSRVQRTFQQFSCLRAQCGKNAAQVASELLNKYATEYVPIQEVAGALTDHFDPKNNIVGLSSAVYEQCSVSALAVAAHEIGHVLQYQENFAPIRARNAILPVANLSSGIAPWIVIAGLFFGSNTVAMIGVILFGTVLLFQLITLPVEFNASARGLRMLEEGGYLGTDQIDPAKKVLRAAAMTYVWATIAALLSFLRLLAIASSNRRRD